MTVIPLPAIHAQADRMIVDVVDFVVAYAPRWICASCLATVLERDEVDVMYEVNAHVVDGRIEVIRGECLNCEITGTVVRTRERA